MALHWHTTHRGRRYEVRTAGRSVRLYTDGVFHSQYNPARSFSGQVWDLLSLPAFFYERDTIKRVLVLGVGGGAVIRQLTKFISPDHITGVELDAMHLRIARKHFAVRGRKIKLVCAEAKAWVSQYKGPRFDMIVDDVFAEEEGEPVRAIESNATWFAAMQRLLNPCGVLVSNFVSRREFRQSAYFNHQRARASFNSVFEFSAPHNGNAVVAFLKNEASINSLRNNLRQHADTKGLRYRVRQVA